MRQKKVIEIIVPYEEGAPSHPTVMLTDRVVDAVELMVNHGLRRIAVVRNNRPLGMIRLEDAFRELGLQEPPLKDRTYRSDNQ